MMKSEKMKFVLLMVFGFLSYTVEAAVNIQHWQTSQGSEVYFVENHDLPIVDISTNFYAGSSYDTANQSGLAAVTRHMMTLGAGGISEEEISKRMADIGARLGGDFDVDRAGFKLRTLSSRNELNKALAIYQTILQQPDFSADILDREKNRIMAGLEESATQPESIASKTYMQLLYGNHPYALEESGEIATVSALKRDDLIQFYQQHYGANGAVIALMGDLTRAQANEIAENISKQLPKSAKPKAITSVTYPTQALEKRITHPASQAHILLGYPGIKRGDADYYPLYVGNYVLGGGGFVSRLTEEVREKRGLVYSVYSYFMPMAELGPFQIGLQTKKEQSAEALKVVQTTLNEFIEKGITEAELKAAKQNIVGGFPMRLDSNAKILDYLAMIGFYKLPPAYLEEFSQKVNAVTVAQIKEAFKRRIDPSKFVTVVVGASE